MKLHLSDAVDPRIADVQHDWWFPEKETSASEPFGVYESNAITLCPDSLAFCSPEIRSWPYTALMCRIERLIFLTLCEMLIESIHVQMSHKE